MEKKEFDDSLLSDFEDVEDISDEQFEQLNDELDGNDKDEDEETQPNQVLEEQSNAIKEQNDLSLEDLESLLPQEVNQEVVEETIDNKGDLNVALHQSREKTSNFKSQNDLLRQEIELLKQQVEFSKVNNSTQPTQVNETVVETDVLKDLEDTDMLTKADFQKALKHQMTQQAQTQQEQIKVQNREKALSLELDFNTTHGDDLGLLSYRNIANLHNTGKIQLTQGQIFDIENAISNGKNPAEILYDTIIESVPALKQKKFEMDIKRMIKSKGVTKEIAPASRRREVDDLNLSVAPKNLDNLYDSLSDF